MLLVLLSKDPSMYLLKKRISSVLKHCGIHAWLWLMAAMILVAICPNYSEECSQIALLQRHLLWVKPNVDTQCCLGLHPNLNKNLFFT